MLGILVSVVVGEDEGFILGEGVGELVGVDVEDWE